MRFAYIIPSLLASSLYVFAAPLEKRSHETGVSDAQLLVQDIGILNYALTLEHLEYAFYRDGLAKFKETDFNNTETFERFQNILEHEKTHVDVLSSVIKSLNGTAVPECEYDFGYTDMNGFLSVARALENTGVSAYTGAIDKIHDAGLVTAGATIATVEARHASYLNQLLGFNPFPAAFDTPLNAQTVVSIASPFIKKCPYDLGVTPFPKLTANYLGDNHTIVSFDKSLVQPENKFYCTWLYSNFQEQTSLFTNYMCNVPQNATGDVYLFVTNSTNKLTLADYGSVIAGPSVVSL